MNILTEIQNYIDLKKESDKMYEKLEKEIETLGDSTTETEKEYQEIYTKYIQHKNNLKTIINSNINNINNIKFDEVKNNIEDVLKIDDRIKTMKIDVTKKDIDTVTINIAIDISEWCSNSEIFSNM